MDVHITARHFTAHESLRKYAVDTITKLEKYYKGIVRADMVLSYEKAVNSVKVAELHVAVYGTVLKTVSKTDNFEKSVDSTVDKIERQIKKYKSKLREKKKITIRRTQAKV
jgi:putative sigma-54 modulation protein